MDVAAPALFTKRRQAILPGVFVFWHLLSLDAPTVAVVWAWAFARAAHVPLSAVSAAVLGIGAWLVYIADRLLDSRPASARNDLRERHHFHAQHSRALLIAGFTAIIPLLVLIWRMPATARREDAIVFAVAMAYFAFVHLPFPRMRFPRELIVGVVFALACAIPAWSQMSAVPAGWIVLVPLFAALCWLNIAAIHVWEQAKIDKSRIIVTVLALAIAIFSGGLALAARSILRDAGVLRLAVAVLASALLLFALDRDHRRALRREPGKGESSTLAIRILADAALLTPLLFAIPWRI